MKNRPEVNPAKTNRFGGKRTDMKTKPTAKTRQHASILILIAAVALVATPSPSHADIMYVSSFDNTIEKFDLATGASLGIFANTGLNSPCGLAFDGAGNLYVANGGDSTILKFTSDGVGSVYANSSLSGPFGLAFDTSGNLYAANSFGSTITRFTPAGTPSVFESGLANPAGLAFDRAGNLYVASYSDNTIRKFTPEGFGSIFAVNGGPGVYTYGMAFDNAGNLYAANNEPATQTGWVQKFTSLGAGSRFATAGLRTPMGLTFDRAGNLYVADLDNNTIEKFSSTGAHLGVFANTGTMPTFIAIVPEPSTWSLLGIGLPTLLALRRRAP
jgi:sugar lactone lactonase YvrE